MLVSKKGLEIALRDRGISSSSREAVDSLRFYIEAFIEQLLDEVAEVRRLQISENRPSPMLELEVVKYAFNNMFKFRYTLGDVKNEQ